MKQAPKVPKVQSVHAILILDGNYLLQLRDNKSTISAPGQWSLFGGKLKSGETPLQTMEREIYEELSIKPAEYKYLWFTDYYSPFEKTITRTWIFVSDVTAVWSSHKLQEGQAVRAFSFEQLPRQDMPWVMYQTLERFHPQQEKALAIDENKKMNGGNPLNGN